MAAVMSNDESPGFALLSRDYSYPNSPFHHYASYPIKEKTTSFKRITANEWFAFLRGELNDATKRYSLNRFLLARFERNYSDTMTRMRLWQNAAKLDEPCETVKVAQQIYQEKMERLRQEQEDKEKAEREHKRLQAALLLLQKEEEDKAKGIFNKPEPVVEPLPAEPEYHEETENQQYATEYDHNNGEEHDMNYYNENYDDDGRSIATNNMPSMVTQNEDLDMDMNGDYNMALNNEPSNLHPMYTEGENITDVDNDWNQMNNNAGYDDSNYHQDPMNQHIHDQQHDYQMYPGDNDMNQMIAMNQMNEYQQHIPDMMETPMNPHSGHQNYPNQQPIQQPMMHQHVSIQNQSHHQLNQHQNHQNQDFNDVRLPGMTGGNRNGAMYQHHIQQEVPQYQEPVVEPIIEQHPEPTNVDYEEEEESRDQLTELPHFNNNITTDHYSLAPKRHITGMTTHATDVSQIGGFDFGVPGANKNMAAVIPDTYTPIVGVRPDHEVQQIRSNKDVFSREIQNKNLDRLVNLLRTSDSPIKKKQRILEIAKKNNIPLTIEDLKELSNADIDILYDMADKMMKEMSELQIVNTIIKVAFRLFEKMMIKWGYDIFEGIADEVNESMFKNMSDNMTDYMGFFDRIPGGEVVTFIMKFLVNKKSSGLLGG